MRRRFTILFLTATIAGSLGAECPTQAQDEADPVDGQAVLPRPRVAMTDEQFEQLFYRQFGGVQGTRRRLERRLAWEIERVNQAYGLTPEQAKKLQVAGRGDIKRFFEDMHHKKEILERSRGDAVTRLGLSMELNASPYNIHEKIFIEGSIFDKTLKLTLGPEKWRMRERVRLDFYRSRVEWAVATGFGSLQLKDEQQRDFVRLIVAETRPLRRYGAQDFNAVLIQTARLPRDKLKAIFDDGQWKGLSEMLVHSKELETTLMWEGYLPLDESADAARDGTSKDGAKPG